MRAARQARGENRAFARLTCHCHIAAHHAGELSGDGEPEPGAAEALCGRRISLAEFLEQLRLLFRRHADAGIGDGQLNEVAAVAHPAAAQRHLAYFPFPSGLTTWRAHDEKPGQWTERVFITLLGPWDRGAGGRSESRSRSHALHASLTVIAMHIDGIASFITLPVAAVLVVTLVLLIATVVLVTLALRRDGD